MIDLNQEAFNRQIKEFALIEFWSSACSVCDKAEVYLDKLVKAYGSKIFIAKTNLDKTAQFIETYSISKLPTFILFRNSLEIARIQGFRNEQDIEKMIRQHF
jgi:thioredoxin-like negative regulator of GroEL